MSLKKATFSIKWLLLRLRPLLRLLQNFRGSPEAIAGGFSIGLFLALTPTIGVQLLIAVFLATFFKLSRPATLFAVMVTNPLTIAPIFTFNYWVGRLFFEGPSVGEVSRQLLRIAKEMAKLNVWEVGAQMRAFAGIGQDILIPLIVGSLLVAAASAALSYVILLRVLWFFKLHRERKRAVKKRNSSNQKPG